MSLAIDLLGPLRVSLDGRDLDVTAGRLRVLLAMLALSPTRPVTVESLARALWGDQQPENPRRGVQTYVTRLRNALGGSGSWIDTEPSGYRLRVAPAAVDGLRFGQLVAAADHADQVGQKRALLTEALVLWRGTPFEDLPSAWLSGVEAPQLVERYLSAVAKKADLDLADGHHEGLIPDLRKLTQLYPLHEALWARLLVALARGGRPADALAAYETVRSHLAEELGADPGAELKLIYAHLLSGALPENGTVRRPPLTPRQLPAAAALFTGRCSEAADLERVGSDVGPRVTVVNGMAGTGKTALALHAAHRMASRFPDGQLFVDLRGHSVGRVPMEPADALDAMLRALGVEHSAIPPDLDEKSALFRTRMADRRILVVLDDAANKDQIVPLLPGAADSRVIITSRRRLGALSSAHHIDLPALSVGDALALLRRAVGEQRLASTPNQDLIRLVRMCGRLPLVLLDAAARLRAHPAWGPAELSAWLALEEQRLNGFDDGRTSIAAALDMSYRNLPEHSRKAYRLLGLHPGTDFDGDAAAALTGMPATATCRVIEDLMDAHLVDEPHSGRYQFQELVRLHAAALGRKSRADHAHSMDRLLDHYGQTAAAAVAAIAQQQAPGFPTAELALNWLDAETSNLLASGLYAADGWRPKHLLLLSDVLAQHLQTRNRYSDAEKLHGRALAVARELQDQPAQLTAMLGLGATYHRQDRTQDAVDTLRNALRLARAIGDHNAEMVTLTSLGHVERKLRRLESATGHYNAALALAKMAHRPVDQVDALGGLGRILLLRRRWQHALGSFEQADRLARSIGDGSRGLNAVSGLGDAFRLMGDHQRAEAQYRRALKISEDVGDRNWQMESSHGLGLLYRATGQSGRSVEYHHSALRIATDLNHYADQARAHDGLAKARLGIGHSAIARRHWRRALDILSDISAQTTVEGEVTVGAIRTHLAERL